MFFRSHAGQILSGLGPNLSRFSKFVRISALAVQKKLANPVRIGPRCTSRSKNGKTCPDSDLSSWPIIRGPTSTRVYEVLVRPGKAWVRYCCHHADVEIRVPPMCLCFFDGLLSILCKQLSSWFELESAESA